LATPAEGPGLPERVLLFDGVCVFCDGAVRWLIARDPTVRLHFAPLQGETAAALCLRHPQIPEDLDTAVLVERIAGEERVLLRSAAVLRVLALLDSPWSRAAWLRVLPRFLTDVAYGLFARVRYRLFGRSAQCHVPTAEERLRFLD
jgi:predicted DCC family thiol-disulfide oxidoreductase YuxK